MNLKKSIALPSLLAMTCVVTHAAPFARYVDPVKQDVFWVDTTPFVPDVVPQLLPEWAPEPVVAAEELPAVNGAAVDIPAVLAGTPCVSSPDSPCAETPEPAAGGIAGVGLVLLGLKKLLRRTRAAQNCSAAK